MSDIETLERLLRRRPGLGPKERAAVRGLLEENARLMVRALEILDQVDEQQQWLDEINVLLGDHTNTQEERLARLRGILCG